MRQRGDREQRVTGVMKPLLARMTNLREKMAPVPPVKMHMTYFLLFLKLHLRTLHKQQIPANFMAKLLFSFWTAFILT